MMFSKERAVIQDATATARRGIDTSLVIASAALLIAIAAIALVVISRG
jgi:branched-subunit amino acid ABC-type transport system permease component